MFKNGKFRYKSDGHNITIDRSGPIQKEYFFRGKDTVTDVLIVKWMGN